MNSHDSHLEGRTCRKLRAMLEGLGLTDVDLWPQKGAWRTNWKLDVYRWEGRCKLPAIEGGFQEDRALCSWDTMRACVRARAIVVEPDAAFSLMVSAAPGRASELIRSA